MNKQKPSAPEVLYIVQSCIARPTLERVKVGYHIETYCIPLYSKHWYFFLVESFKGAECLPAVHRALGLTLALPRLVMVVHWKQRQADLIQGLLLVTQ